jgi:type IV secretion system protein TrbJ
MKNIKNAILSATFTILVGMSANTYAIFGVGDIVFDPTLIAGQVEQLMNDTSSLANEATMIANQVTDYTNQLSQLENAVQNTIAPVAYVWDQAQQKMNMLRNISSTLDRYKSRFGSIDGYLSKFQDVNYYRNSPCFRLGNCTQAELKRIHDNLAFGSETQKQYNDASFKNWEAQQAQLESDAIQLQRLQSNIQGYDGQMKALQGANQLAAMQVSQIMQLREMIGNANAAILQRQQALQNVEAMQQANANYQRQDRFVIGTNNKTWKFGE